ncbi:MAG: UPF0164 family protein [Candidatus Edwardsbacteria bacterium]|jgi:hypothetical protein|nr:UPF0164 family protein [Candidatus Edwardsbacteria bacterium]
MMRWTRAIVLPLAALALAAGALPAGQYGGEFLNIPVGARAYGLGGAFGPLVDDASAAYWNPAGLAALARPEVGVTHTELFGGLAVHDFIAAAWPLPRLSLGVAWIRLGVDDIPRFSHTVGTPPQGSFGDNENALFVSAASARGLPAWSGMRAMTLRYGGSLKVIYDKLDDKQATGLGIDAGLQAQLPLGRPGARPSPAASRFGAVTVGLVAADIGGTAISWNTARQHQDVREASGRAGIAYALGIEALRATATACYETSTDELLRNRFGVELSYRGLAALRAGHDGQGTALGAGISYWRLRVDYGFNRHELGNCHRVSAAFRL